MGLADQGHRSGQLLLVGADFQSIEIGTTRRVGPALSASVPTLYIDPGLLVACDQVADELAGAIVDGQ